MVVVAVTCGLAVDGLAGCEVVVAVLDVVQLPPLHVVVLCVVVVVLLVVVTGSPPVGDGAVDVTVAPLELTEFVVPDAVPGVAGIHVSTPPTKPH